MASTPCSASPGVHNLELYRGLELARLRHVLARHEQNAGFAADGYARASAPSGRRLRHLRSRPHQRPHRARPGVLRLGAAYCSSPARRCAPRSAAAGACCTSSPTSARWPPASRGFAGSARSDGELREHLRGAFAALRAARPRPAYLDVPLDLLAAPTALRPEVFPAASAFPAAPRAAIEAAQALLEQRTAAAHHRRRRRARGGRGAAAPGRGARRATSSRRWRARA